MNFATSKLLLTLTLLTGSLSHGYTLQALDQPVEPTKIFVKAKKEKLGIPPSERKMKDELIVLRKKRPERFDSQSETLVNPLMRELHGNTSEIEKAKVIARFYFFDAIRNNWKQVGNTAVNEINENEFKTFAPYLRKQLQKMEFVLDPGTQMYRFDWKWGTALVSKDLKTIRYRLEVAMHNDGKKAPEGADKIVIPETPYLEPVAPHAPGTEPGDSEL